MFRNLILYQLPGKAIPSPADFDAAIAAAGAIRDPGPLELASFGWRPPLPGRESTDLVRRIGLDVLLAFGTCARILPAQVVNDAVAEWLTGEGLPDEVTLGDECELRDPGDDGAIVRVRRQDLGAEEVREHVNAGKQATALQVGYDGRVSFVLCEDLSLRKLRFSDAVTDQLGDVSGEDASAELDARFALMTGELRRLFSFLAEQFDCDHSTLTLDGGQAPPESTDPATAGTTVGRGCDQ